MRKINNKKMKKALLTLGLGLGLGFSATQVSADWDMTQVCNHLNILCNTGNHIACGDASRLGC